MSNSNTLSHYTKIINATLEGVEKEKIIPKNLLTKLKDQWHQEIAKRKFLEVPPLTPYEEYKLKVKQRTHPNADIVTVALGDDPKEYADDVAGDWIHKNIPKGEYNQILGTQAAKSAEIKSPPVSKTLQKRKQLMRNFGKPPSVLPSTTSSGNPLYSFDHYNDVQAAMNSTAQDSKESNKEPIDLLKNFSAQEMLDPEYTQNLASLFEEKNTQPASRKRKAQPRTEDTQRRRIESKKETLTESQQEIIQKMYLEVSESDEDGSESDEEKAPNFIYSYLYLYKRVKDSFNVRLMHGFASINGHEHLFRGGKVNLRWK